jgi:hypothetical protein
MSEASFSRIQSHCLDALPADLVELEEAIATLPAEHRSLLVPLLGNIKQSTMRRRRILGLVQDALAQLRLDMKYLLFDLEATRRERDDYRRQLEQA